MAPRDTYLLSFTTGGLFLPESVLVARLYLRTHYWKLVKKEVVDENLLQLRVQSSRKRVLAEISGRLATFSDLELSFFAAADSHDQVNLLWIAVCRRYQFIADFAVEVLRERYLGLKSDVKPEEFEIFFNRKSEWHEELDCIGSLTRGKLRQVLFKILREADLISAKMDIIPASVSPALVQLLGNYSDELNFFPMFEPSSTGAIQ